VYGGYGYCQEYPVEQYCRDNKISSIYEGTNGIQALDLVGRKVTGSGGAYVLAYLELVDALIARLRVDEDLGPLVSKLTAAKREFLKISQIFIETMPHDPACPLLWAVPFQEMLGHVATAACLLDGAAVAVDKLRALQDASDTSDVGRLIAGNQEAAFYHGRVASARYFVNAILPQVHALSAAIQSGDTSALEVTFT
jgi:hypothetical protein